MGHMPGHNGGTATMFGRAGTRTIGTGRASWLEQQLIAVLAVLLLAATLASPALQQVALDLDGRIDDALSSSQTLESGVVPDGLTAEEWADIQAQITALQATPELTSQVTVEPVATPTLRLGRFADAAFATAGATFTFDDHTVRLGTVSVGGPIAAAAPEVDTTNAESVIYDRGIVEEWFVETDRGVEQGWTIAEAPAGVTDELVIEVTAATELIPLPVTDDTIHFLDSTGTVQAQYTGLLAWDANGADLPATMTYAGDRIEITVDVAGAAYPITVDPTFTEDQTLNAVATSAYARHGFAIDVDFGAALGPIAVVATPGSDVSGTKNIGAVTVLRRSGGTWNVEARLFPNAIDATPTDADEFGFSVAVRDTRIAVGAPRYDNGGVNAGAVHVYDRDGGTGNWLFSDVLYECSTTPCNGAGEGAPTHRFGASLAFGVDENDLLIGAPGSARFSSNGGIVYIYRDGGAGLTFQAAGDHLANPDLVISDEFGAAIDTSIGAPGQVLVGAPGANGGEGTAYWADYNATQWVSIDELSAGLTPVPGEALGQDVSLSLQSGAASPTYLMAIAAQDRVVLFTADASFGPTQNSENAADQVTFASDASALTTIDSSKNTAVIGRSVAGAAGSATLVEWDSGAQIIGSSGLIVNDFGAADDLYGAGIALADTEVLVGAPGALQSDLFNDLPESGLVTIKPLAGIAAPPIGFSTAAQTAVGGSFGGQIAIDGNTMVISSLAADRSAEGGGAAYIYTRASSAANWVLADVVTEPAGDANTNDRFGWDVAVRNGVVAVSAPNFGSNGQVYVFDEFATNDWRQRGSTINSAAGAFGYWGSAIAFGQDENELFIGAFDATTTLGDGAVFETTFGADWSAPTVIATPTGLGSNFGSDVETAIDGGTLWLGVGDSRDTEFNGNFQGGAFTVLTRPLAGGAWTVETKVGGDYGRGRTLALEPNRVVVSSFDEFGTDFIDVFEGPTWTSPVATLPGDEFGSFDLSPSRLAVSVDDGTVALFNLPVSGTLTTPDDIFDPAGATGSMAVGLDDGISVVAGQSTLLSNEGQVYAANFAPSVVYGEPNVDIDGKWLIWGDPENDAAYIFEYSGGGWNLGETLTGVPGTSYGASVAVEGRVFLVGAPGDDSTAVDSGAVFHYHRNGTGADIDPVDTYVGGALDDQLGFAVELLGEQAFFGAPGSGTGSVDIYNGINNSGGSIFQSITDGNPGDEFGASLATAQSGSRSVVVVGSPGAVSDGGVVRVFTSDNAAAFAVNGILPISVGAGDRVGSDLDAGYLTFNRLAVLVGAEGEDEAYYVLVDPGNAFESTTALSNLVVPSNGFGRSVSMSGDRLLIGSDDDLYVMRASHDGADLVTTSGGFALDPTITGVAIEGRFGAAVPPAVGTTPIDLTGTELTAPEEIRGTSDAYPSDKLVNPVATDGDQFGFVAADGDTIIVGAPNADKDGFSEETGRVFVFVDDGTNYVFDQELDGDSLGNNWGKDLQIAGNTAVVISDTEVAWFTRPSAGSPFSLEDTALVPSGVANSVDTDGQTLVVGVLNGSAYVWEDGPTVWNDGGEITIPGFSLGFARDVAVSGNVIYVSRAPLPFSGTPAGDDYGSVEVWINEGGGTIDFTGTELTGDRTGNIWSDFYGGKIDADGDQLIVGASHDLDRAGGAYLYDCAEAGLIVSCSPTGFFDGDGLQGAEFGHDVQVDGDNAIVSARQSGGVVFSGNTILLRRVNGTWQRTTQLFDAPDADAIDQYINLALTDAAIVMGGTEEDGRGTNAGAVTVFPIPDANEVVNPSIYSGQLDLSGFGIAVATDGDTMVVGDRFAEAGNEGLAYVFDRTVDGVWQFTQELDAGFGTGANGGQSVAIEADRIVIGAPFHNGASEGGVAVFERSGSVWTQNGGILTSPTGGGWLGWSVDIEGDRIVAGAPQRNVAAAVQAGGYSIFDRSGGVWGFTSDVNLPTPEANSRFGWDVVLESGDVYTLSLRSELVSNIGQIHLFTGATTLASSYTPTMGAPLLDLDVAGGVAAIVNVDGKAILHTVGTSTETNIATSEDETDTTVANAIAFDGSNVVVGFETAGGPVVEEFSYDGVNVTFVGTRTPDIVGGTVASLDLSSAGTLSIGVLNQSNARGLGAGSVFAIDLGGPPPPDDPALQFNLILPGANTVQVAPSGISIAEIDAAAIAAASDGNSTLASTALGQTEIEDAPLSAIAFGATPIPDAIINNPDLYSLPLIDVEIDTQGGWPAILAGTDFETRPLVDITLGEVLEADQNGVFDATPAAGPLDLTLQAINVNGTPLSAIPLSAILLGSIPLSAIPLSAIGVGDPCVEWAFLLDADFTCADLENSSATEAALRGAPLSAIDLGAIPLSAIDIANTPLSAIPLSAIELEKSPLSAIPLSAIPLSAIDVNASPLSAIPLSAIPLSAIPLSAIPLSAIDVSGTPLSAIPLSAIPLSAIEVENIPLSAIDVTGAPLSAIPLSAIPLSAIALADTPLSAIPLSAIGSTAPDWCTYLTDAAPEYTCDPAAIGDETIVGLSIEGVPLSAIPLSAIPLSAIGTTFSPLSAIPLSAIPLSAIPLSAIPLSAIDLNGTPLSAIPLSAVTVSGSTLADVPLSAIDVQGSPLSAIPLSAIDVNASPLSAIPLSAIPLSAIQVSDAPLSAITVDAAGPNATPLSAIPLSAIDIVGSPLSAIPLSAIPLSAIPLSAIDCDAVDCDVDTLGDAFLAGAFDPSGYDLADIAILLDVGLAEVASFFLDFTLADVEQAVAESNQTIADLTDLDALLLGDVPLDDAAAGDVKLADLGNVLYTLTIEELANALLDANGNEVDPVLAEAELAAILAALGLTVGDLDSYGDATLGEFLAGPNVDGTLADLGGILALLTVEQFAALGALTANYPAGTDTLGEVADDPVLDLGALTLEDLIGLLIPEFDTLTIDQLIADLEAEGSLLGFVLADLLLAVVGVEDLALSGVDFTSVDSGVLPIGTVPDVPFRAGFEISATVFDYPVEITVDLPATATYVPGSATVEDGVASTPIEPVVSDNTLTFTVSGVGPDMPMSVDFLVRPEVSLGSTSLNASARIVGTDVFDLATRAVTVQEGLEPNNYPETTPIVEDTVYLTYISTTTDRDVFEITVGERDRLAIQLSNLTADLDVVLYGDPDDPATSAALSGTSDQATIDPVLDPDAGGQSDSAPLDDFPRIDLFDPNLTFLELANADGLADEIIISDPLPAGTYYVQVHGANGARNQEPATLQVQVLEADTRPACSTFEDIFGGPLPAAAPGGAPVDLTGNTLFLVNEQRLEQLYGAAGRADVMNSLEALTLYLDANPALDLDPIVYPVESIASVASAYAAWDTDATCDPEVANAVVGAIVGDVIDPIRGQLDHIIVVGGDDVIPMARLKDATEIANEYDYRHELVGDLNGPNADNVSSFTATFWESRYLSDDPYGESAARSIADRFLYVPDVSLGRLVENPAEIASALDTFVTFDGTLDMSTAAVAGYDFLSDSSEEIVDTLDAAGLTVDGDLADGIDDDNPGGPEPWDREDAEDLVVPAGGSAADLISFNAHFDHYRALPAAGDQVPGFLDNFETTALANAIPDTVLEGTLLFSAGCHGGLSVSDVQIGATNLDWAQATAQRGALWVGNTGFGYGDTETVAYTERLMAIFAEEVVSPLQLPGVSAPTTIGQAWAISKNRFVSGLTAISVYDEKAVQEATFYGLPIYRVGIAAEPAPPAPVNTPSPDVDGTPALNVNIDATNAPTVTDRGTYYSNPSDEGGEQIINVPGSPVQPKLTDDISVVDAADTSVLSQVAHGGLVLDMTSTYISPVDPVVASVIFDESSDKPEPELGNGVFPARPLTITQSTTATGQRQSLSIATGQYRPGAELQRLDDDIDVVVYYADPNEDDFNAPRIGRVNRSVENGQLTITVNVEDDANGVDRVYVLLAENPGAGTVDWTGFDLQNLGSGAWAGSIQLDPTTTAVEFLVQAKDGVGNVGYANDKAGNFNDSTDPEPEPPTPVNLEVDIDQTNADPNGSEWFVGPVDIEVTSGTEAGFSVNGGDINPVPPSGVITIDQDGQFFVEVVNQAGESEDFLIKIDTGGLPEVAVSSPVTGASYISGSSTVYDFGCLDTSLESCEASVNGSPVSIGDPLPTTPGTYVLTVTATDAVSSGSTTATVTFSIQSAVNNVPEIDLIVGPGAPQLISDGVNLEIDFGDSDGTADDYTITVDWGDYTDEDETIGSTVCTASSGSPTTGNPSCEIVNEPTGAAPDGMATASYTYAEPGVYAIEVTITDADGDSDTSLFEFAVVFDPAGGRVSGAGWYWSGPEAYADEEPWGGPAFFGYRARYRSGADTPIGRTKLHLLGEFFFRSTSYDYLIVNDTIAVAEGTGRIGRDRGYRFRVQGIDNGWHDFFQITIWDDETGEIVYDNGILYDEGDPVLLGGIRVRS